MDFLKIDNGSNQLQVAVQGDGPVILCVHGWPELWYSWRHQIHHFSQRGYRVAAMDVRGYGGSSKPDAISAYTMQELTSDVAAVARALSDQPVVLFGHDWGAPIVWNTALRHPEAVRAVAGLSVPYMPAGEASFLDIARAIYPDRFFYQLYFQAEGVVEAEVEADFASALRKIYFSLSGDAPADDWLKHKPKDASLLDALVDPDPFPAWMTPEDLDVYVQAFSQSGFRGPINRYRAQDIDALESAPIRGKLIEQPACFIGGDRDAVRHFVPQGDMYADPGAACADFRGATIIPKVGHWVQQEAPAATNAALDQFLKGL